jgi:hypothetical protein
VHPWRAGDVILFGFIGISEIARSLPLGSAKKYFCILSCCVLAEKMFHLERRTLTRRVGKVVSSRRLTAQIIAAMSAIAPIAYKMLRCRDCPLSANSGLMHRSKTHIQKDRYAAASPKSNQTSDASSARTKPTINVHPSKPSIQSHLSVGR